MKSFLCYDVAMEGQKPYLAMIFIQFVYAGMALFSKAAIAKGMNAYVFVVYRQAFASLALAPFAFFLERKKDAPLSYNLLCKIFFISLCGITLSLNLYYFAINYTSATFAAATTNLIPAITFIMAALLRMESITIKHLHGMAKVLGAVVGVCGALVFAFVKGPPIKLYWYSGAEKSNSNSAILGSSGVEWIKGSLFMLLANSAWSLWLVLQGPIIKQYQAKLRLTTLQCFFSCLQSTVVAIAVERHPSAWKIGWDIHLLSVAYCGIIVTGITYWLQVWAIEKKGPVFTSMFTPVALIITAIISAVLWKESLYCGSVGGAILLVGGLYSVLWGKNKEDRKSEMDKQRQVTKEEVILECITHD
ncbi:hypothetical protein I3760_15G015100 [Carya illinoinensis]|uniref:WAT1-related protein n=1 Tax=Carya illinoinensis TaxID=32201 RepID=A0A922D5K9_CARIL|nr:hypothetical protein I3760_15G015100 [Carya illinoinensis]KAG6673931.1 hypothetical protein I3842_15G015800 [Carya illinoinensis]